MRLSRLAGIGLLLMASPAPAGPADPFVTVSDIGEDGAPADPAFTAWYLFRMTIRPTGTDLLRNSVVDARIRLDARRISVRDARCRQHRRPVVRRRTFRPSNQRKEIRLGIIEPSVAAASHTTFVAAASNAAA